METTYFIFLHYFSLTVFASISYILGKGVLNGISKPNTSGIIFLYTSLGMGIIIFILFALALLQVFTPLYTFASIFIALLLSFIRIGLKEFTSEIKEINTHVITTFRKNWVWLFPLSLLLGLALMILPLSPPQAWDETAYHLPYAKHYVENQGLSVNSFLRYPLYAHNYVLFYSLALMAYDDVLAHLFHAFAALLTALGIYSLGSMIDAKKTGLIAAILFISTPVVYGLMKTAYIDLGLSLFVFLSLYAIILWDKTEDNLYLWIAGVSIGLAIGTKYSGFLYLLITSVFFIIFTKKVKHLAYFIGIGLLVGSPWYIRNLLISGNPIPPFASDFFGYWVWNEQDLHGQKNELTSYGVEKNTLNFIQLPWYFITEPDRFREHISFALLLWFPFLPLFFLFSRLKKILFIYLFIAIIAWFLSSQLVRYLVPIMPVMSILSAVIIISLFRLSLIKKLFKKPDFLRKIKINHNIYSISIAIFMSILLVFALNKKKVPINEIMRNEHLSKRLEYYQLIQEINKTPNSITYQLGFENSFYYAQGIMMGDWFGDARYIDIMKYNKDIEGLRKYLTQQFNVNLILINKNRDPFKQFYLDIHPVLENNRVFENEHGIIYSLVP